MHLDPIDRLMMNNFTQRVYCIVKFIGYISNAIFEPIFRVYVVHVNGVMSVVKLDHDERVYDALVISIM